MAKKNNYVKAFESLFIKKEVQRKGYGMPQKNFLQKNKRNDYMMFNDSDRDGVINGLDCFPFNNKRHGLITKFKNLTTGHGFRENEINQNDQYQKERFERHKQIQNMPLNLAEKRLKEIERDNRFMQEVRNRNDADQYDEYYNDEDSDKYFEEYDELSHSIGDARRRRLRVR